MAQDGWIAQTMRADAVDFERPVTVADAVLAARGLIRVAPGPMARARIAAGHARLQRCISERRLVYGVTTGFGPLADRLVAPEDIETLQRNLICHLATGIGQPLPWAAARAMAFARLSSVAQGWSGASDAVVDALCALLNSPFAPRVPQKGTVGASGDLTPLSHLALALMGEGAFIDADGAAVPNDRALSAMGAAPLTLAARDGLALVNGTSAMTGIAALNAASTSRLVAWAEALTAAMADLMQGRLEAWDDAFACARPHPGQAAAAAALRTRAAGSSRCVAAPAAESLLEQAGGAGARIGRAPQDAYTLRCAPQVLGAVRDAADWHALVVTRELNAATDNPIFPEDGPPALHGGNFMGQHVGLVSDTLSTAILILAGLAERQIARLTDERLNGGLPAFLNRGPEGLNSGLMGAQVSATALLAEMRTRAVPASAQSISTNGANQDVVSMGTIAARNAAAQIEDAWSILAILALAAAQGRDIAGDHGMAPATRALADWVRVRAPAMLRDRPLSGEIAQLATDMADAAPPG